MNDKLFDQYAKYTCSCNHLENENFLKITLKNLIPQRILSILSDFSLLEYNFQNLNLLNRKTSCSSLIAQFTNLKYRISVQKDYEEILDGLKIFSDLRIDKIDFLLNLLDNPESLTLSCNTLFNRNVAGINKIARIKNKSLMKTFIEFHTLELEIVKKLIQTHFLISNLHFIDPILDLYSIKTNLNVYSSTGLIDKHQLRRSNYCQWLHSFYQILLSKCSLYWCNIYLKQTIDIENTKRFFSKCQPDLIDRIREFHSKLNNGSINIIFDSNSQSYPFLGHGYFLPISLTSVEECTGSYFTIFTYPESGRIINNDHQPIASCIDEMSKLERNSKKLLFNEESNNHISIIKLEPRIYLVYICEKNSGLEMDIFVNFCKELSDEICLFKLCNNLKNKIK